MSTSHHLLGVVAVFRARAGQQEALGRSLLALVEPTRKEPGSVLYHICRSQLDDDEWVVMENWRDRAAFDFHMSTPYIVEFMRQVPQLCAADPEIRFHDIVSPAYPAQ